MKRRTVGSRIRSLGPVVAAVGAALLVTGCGAGQITQTDTQVAAINGTSAGVGTIAIRNAEVSYPETDGDGPAVYPPNSDAQTTMPGLTSNSARMSLMHHSLASIARRASRTPHRPVHPTETPGPILLVLFPPQGNRKRMPAAELG